MNCSTLRERAAGSPPNASQVSLLTPVGKEGVVQNSNPTLWFLAPRRATALRPTSVRELGKRAPVFGKYGPKSADCRPQRRKKKHKEEGTKSCYPEGWFEPVRHIAPPLFIPPVAKAAAIPTAGNEQSSSWLSLVTVLSTWELRNHCRSDPVQVQSTTRRRSRKAFAAKSKSDTLVVKCLERWVSRPTFVDNVVQTYFQRVLKQSLHFSICACRPCARAMLIFSVSFQF